MTGRTEEGNKDHEEEIKKTIRETWTSQRFSVFQSPEPGRERKEKINKNGKPRE